jgi:VIT1/CCC1 family predicted Fe2+/Mn2+ transporter
MNYQSAHEELHYINRSGWLRAAVLDANDGIVSVSSLVVGVAAAAMAITAGVGHFFGVSV